MIRIQHHTMVLVLILLGTLATLPAIAVEVVYLKTGSTLLAESHEDKGETVLVSLLSGSKVLLNATEIDKIIFETSPPIQLSELKIDPEKVLPDMRDPLDWWLDLPVPTTNETSRFFLPFDEQLRRGEEIPLAKSLADIRYARRKKVRKIEFYDRTLYLGMDLQYHDQEGMTVNQALDEFEDIADRPTITAVLDFLSRLRASAYDPRKEQIISQVIDLRDRLDPDYGKRIVQVEKMAPRIEQPEEMIQTVPAR